MSTKYDFSDCCLEMPSVVPSSLLTSASAASTSEWHRAGERIQRRVRFLLRGRAGLASK